MEYKPFLIGSAFPAIIHKKCEYILDKPTEFIHDPRFLEGGVILIIFYNVIVKQLFFCLVFVAYRFNFFLKIISEKLIYDPVVVRDWLAA